MCSIDKFEDVIYIFKKICLLRKKKYNTRRNNFQTSNDQGTGLIGTRFWISNYKFWGFRVIYYSLKYKEWNN